MTIHYLTSVRKTGAGAFLKLLLRWRGGIHKLIFIELTIYLVVFYTINIIYRIGLTEAQHKEFFITIGHLKEYQSKIPISLMLGFYIFAVYKHFTNRFASLPWMMNVSSQLTYYIYGEGEREKHYRNFIIRYMHVALLITIMRIHRHEILLDLEHLVKNNSLTQEEMLFIKAIPFIHIQPFIPISWCMTLLVDARNEELFTNIHGFVYLLEDLNNFRQGLLKMFIDDQISFPLIYTQVITLVVYLYFFFSLLTSQNTIFSQMDLYIPVVTLIEFIVYMGLLKCAIGMLNPMGNNEENFDLNEIIIYNYEVSNCVSNQAIQFAPKRIRRDVHFNESKINLQDNNDFKRSRTNLHG